MFKKICILLFVVFLPHLVVAQEPMVLPVDQTPLVIETENGKVDYQVEIAQSPDEREKGLMYRTDLPSNRVMLFKFDQLTPVSMWMANTPLSLDMLFINEEGVVVSTAQSTTPFSHVIISSVFPVRYVIELNAGQIKQNNITIGNRVIHPAITGALKD